MTVRIQPKKSGGLLKSWQSVCQSYFFGCFYSWQATSVYRGYFPAICRLCFEIVKKVSRFFQQWLTDLLIAALIFSAGYYSAPIFLLRRTFSLYPFCRFFDILREIILTSLGQFHSSVILLKVLLNSSCSAKQFKMKRVSIKKSESEIETG